MKQILASQLKPGDFFYWSESHHPAIMVGWLKTNPQVENGSFVVFGVYKKRPAIIIGIAMVGLDNPGTIHQGLGWLEHTYNKVYLPEYEEEAHG